MWAQAAERQRSELDGIEEGHGVELRLSESVTTLHVRFPRGDKGGRSFGVVGYTRGEDSKADYIADASFKFYFNTLERSYWETPEGLHKFYKVKLDVLIRSEGSGIENLSKYYQRAAVDFVAVYVAEQYRALVKG